MSAPPQPGASLASRPASHPTRPPAPAAAAAPPVAVLVVDDSAVARAVLTDLLRGHPSLRVVGEAASGQEALALLPRLRPEIVLLDVEMPTLDGLETLPCLLGADPGLVVVMVSSLTHRGAEVTLQALRLGAADYVAKPVADPARHAAFRHELVAKLLGLAGRRRAPRAAAQFAPQLPPQPAPSRPSAGANPRPMLVAVGSSTGGPQALFTLAAALGPDLPVPVAVVQHMPPTFTSILAAHLHRLGALACAEAVDGEALRPGRLYVAPGARHLLVERAPDGLPQARLSDAPPENFCRPSVDLLLRSAAAACGGRVLVVMLTGMGHDGLAGTRAVVAAGGAAIAQDEATSVVWGMPGAIAQAGLCRAVLPVGALGARIRLMVGAPP